MTTSSRHDGGLAPDVTFCPRECDLTDLYLRRKITGVDIPDGTGRFFHVADVYSAEPKKLTEKFDEAPGAVPVWYFFSPVRYVEGRKTNARGGVGRKSRTIDGGAVKHWWHSEKGETPVNGGSDYGGYKQYFSYKVKNASTGKDERAGWIMTEYGISPEHGGGDLVLCEIHRSSRAMASDPIVNSKKRKVAVRDHPLHHTASARPAHTADQDEHQLKAASAVEQQRQTGYEHVFDEGFMAEFRIYPELFDGEPVTEEPERYGAADQAAPSPLSNFLQNVEQDFRCEYQSNMVGDLAVPPWSPAAQPENDAAATGLVQTISGYGFPGQNYHDDSQMEASFREEQTEHDKTAAGKVIYGFPCPAFSPENDAVTGLVQTISGYELPGQNSAMEDQTENDKTAAGKVVYGGFPCPAFSPEMIWGCSNGVPMPWQSSSSMSMTFGGRH